MHIEKAATMITNRRLLVTSLLCSWLLAPAAAIAIEVRIGYIHWVPDQGPVLSNVTPEPEDAGLRGAELGIADNNATGRFLDQMYVLETVIASDEEGALAALDGMVENGIGLLVTRVPAGTLQAMAKKTDGKALLFNTGASDDSLRISQCRPNVLHTIPSYAMLTDALAQWLNMRRWKKVFLITGPTEQDKAWADAFRRASKRFGLDIIADKPWTFDSDLRRTASKELPVFTQARDYDATVVADVRGDFGEYVPFNTWLPRPVVGTQGMGPKAWHGVVEAWGAAQLQNRFRELAGREMNSEDYAAWAAIRSIGTTVTGISEADHSNIREHLFSDDFQLAAFKGRKLTYRPWNGQLRQPIPLVHPRGLVATPPLEGFLHPESELDTLGYDRPESDCRIH
ncbi:ABC transporter substrate-binding protein [Marinobacter sp. M-5]|uniref:ABC transporter substrate-binding protein n=1 Tax=Marinobacter sp. M-5 TaxID=3081089 RepID=UPI0039785B44